MKNKQFLLGVLFTLFVLVVFGSGRAYASGCFTDTNTAAACWLKANGIATAYPDGGFHPNAYLTRGDAADFIYRANKVPPRQGDFHISQDLGSVTTIAGSPSEYVERFVDITYLRSTATGTLYFEAPFTIPTSMYGRAVYLKGMKVCYSAAYGNASLSYMEMALMDVDSNGFAYRVTGTADSTIRTDRTCRKYMFVTPLKLAGDNHVVAIIGVNYTATTGYVGITALTAILSPSLQPGVLGAPDVIGDPPADTSPWFSPQE
jgi:hypothetical protein